MCYTIIKYDIKIGEFIWKIKKEKMVKQVQEYLLLY